MSCAITERKAFRHTAACWGLIVLLLMGGSLAVSAAPKTDFNIKEFKELLEKEVIQKANKEEGVRVDDVIWLNLSTDFDKTKAFMIVKAKVVEQVKERVKVTKKEKRPVYEEKHGKQVQVGYENVEIESWEDQMVDKADFFVEFFYVEKDKNGISYYWPGLPLPSEYNSSSGEVLCDTYEDYLEAEKTFYENSYRKTIWEGVQKLKKDLLAICDRIESATDRMEPMFDYNGNVTVTTVIVQADIKNQVRNLENEAKGRLAGTAQSKVNSKSRAPLQRRLFSAQAITQELNEELKREVEPCKKKIDELLAAYYQKEALLTKSTKDALAELKAQGNRREVLEKIYTSQLAVFNTGVEETETLMDLLKKHLEPERRMEYLKYFQRNKEKIVELTDALVRQLLGRSDSSFGEYSDLMKFVHTNGNIPYVNGAVTLKDVYNKFANPAGADRNLDLRSAEKIKAEVTKEIEKEFPKSDRELDNQDDHFLRTEYPHYQSRQFREHGIDRTVQGRRYLFKGRVKRLDNGRIEIDGKRITLADLPEEIRITFAKEDDYEAFIQRKKQPHPTRMKYYEEKNRKIQERTNAIRLEQFKKNADSVNYLYFNGEWISRQQLVKIILGPYLGL